MFRSFQFAFDECLVDESFAVTSVNSLLCPASTCFRIGSKFLCIRPTPTEMQSMSENDFECLASWRKDCRNAKGNFHFERSVRYRRSNDEDPRRPVAPPL
jgi:hypothetical protein